MSVEDLLIIKRSKRAKRVALRLDPVERAVNLVVPEKMPLKKAYYFAKNHEDWIRETLDNLAPPIPFIDGAMIPVFGRIMTLRISYDKSLLRNSISTHNHVIDVKTPSMTPEIPITRYLKKQAGLRLETLAKEKAAHIGENIASVSVRDTRTRWGSCSHENKISFSWRLIFAPIEASDYVVAHEVAHLKHLDHSKAFWNLCRELSSDYINGRYWMQNHGNDLMRYGAVTPYDTGSGYVD
ncbi:MAG: M48 family metallopeptidase [Alphaproteobacteria bacterium]|nr:M48 family metallopeptidase [Alphaproteobacteria bacterium]